MELVFIFSLSYVASVRDPARPEHSGATCENFQRQVKSQATLFEFTLQTGAAYHKHCPGNKIRYRKFLDHLHDKKPGRHPQFQEVAKVGATAGPEIRHATA
ncbi:hypothetical protein [Amycolatopsis decaplanina]|uniref:hypothetical protein n=1 Tax=Amycolatopsis decaplanina TaxID=208441 RepID=UPI001268A671|nr:hypothetical protein [Amycolatopsis decaplanina]